MEKGIDCKGIESGLRLIADKFGKRDGRMNTPFKGENFITPEMVTVKRLNNGIWFELSYGPGIFTQYILGVSLMDEQGNSFEDVQGCVYEFSEVEDILIEAEKLTTSV